MKTKDRSDFSTSLKKNITRILNTQGKQRVKPTTIPPIPRSPKIGNFERNGRNAIQVKEKRNKSPIDNRRNSFVRYVPEEDSLKMEIGEIFPALKEGNAADKKDPTIPIPNPRNQVEMGTE